jgi:hypothetical protein
MKDSGIKGTNTVEDRIKDWELKIDCLLSEYGQLQRNNKKK